MGAAAGATIGHQVLKFSPDGKLLLALGKKGGKRIELRRTEVPIVVFGHVAAKARSRVGHALPLGLAFSRGAARL